MKVKELNREQISQLKQSYYCEYNNNVSWGELIDIDNLISDEEIFNKYHEVEFVEDDFIYENNQQN